MSRQRFAIFILGLGLAGGPPTLAAEPSRPDAWFQPCESVADYRPKGPSRCYRQFNFDWSWIGRATDRLPEFLSEADPARFAEFCREDCVDGVVVMAVPHHGYCSYETKIGAKFPGMKGDWFGRTIDELHKRKIAALGYITLNWNWRYMRANLGRDFIRAKSHDDGSLDGLICLNAPGYLDMVEGYTREVLTQYPVDGLRYDILNTIKGCTCAGCKAFYRERYGEELTEWPAGQWRRQTDFYIATTSRAVARLTRVGRQIKPSLEMWQNSLQSYTPNNLDVGRTQSLAYNEYGDPFRILLLGGVLNKEAIINGVMNHTPVTPDATLDRRQCRLCLVLGGRSYSYFGHLLANLRTTMPGEQMIVWHKRHLAPFYRMVAEIQPYLEGATPVAHVGVVFSEATRYRFPGYDREPYLKPMQQLTEAYLARSVPLEFVNCLDLPQRTQRTLHAPRAATPLAETPSGKDLSHLRLLVLPMTSGLTADQVESLRQYVRQGGSLLVAGDALRHDAEGRETPDFALAAEMGVGFRSLQQGKPADYTVSGKIGAAAVPPVELSSYVEVEPRSGETLLSATAAARSFPLLQVHRLGKGRIACLASLDSPELTQRVIDHLAGPPPVTVAPSGHQAILTHQNERGRWVLHLLSDGDCEVRIRHNAARPTRIVGRYPAEGWQCEASVVGEHLRIKATGAAVERLVVLE